MTNLACLPRFDKGPDVIETSKEQPDTPTPRHILATSREMPGGWLDEQLGSTRESEPLMRAVPDRNISKSYWLRTPESAKADRSQHSGSAQSQSEVFQICGARRSEGLCGYDPRLN
jgi:hypothetical protein